MQELAGWQRYAIYWMPDPGPLADFGARWLGWDAAVGEVVAHPDLPGLPMPVEEITRTPRKYGLHGTIKPPFRLAAGTTVEAMHAVIADLAAGLAPVLLPGLTLSRLGPWIALLPEGDTTALDGLAGRVVAAPDAFRAPPDAAEIARRRPETLSATQRALLDRWGYPHVMEEFRFHVTLSGALPEATGAAVVAALAPLVAPLEPRPFRVDSLCLCGEGTDGRFRLLHRYALTG